VDGERHVREEAAGRLAPLVPSPTTVGAIDAAGRDEAVDLGTPPLGESHAVTQAGEIANVLRPSLMG